MGLKYHAYNRLVNIFEFTLSNSFYAENLGSNLPPNLVHFKEDKYKAC